MTSQPTSEFSEYDFLELVAFDAKANWEGFDYAYEEYPPRFESPELRAVATDYTKLESLWLAHTEAICAFWERPDASRVYDRHLGAADRKSRRGSS